MSQSCCIVTTTIDDANIASTLARGVISKHLAACVQIIPDVSSYYEWHGQLEKAQELILQFKTTQKRAGVLMQYIKTNHSYDIPEIITTRIDKVDPEYEKWIEMAVIQDLS